MVFDFERDLNLEATELRLALPGTGEKEKKQTPGGARSNKRALPDMNEESGSKDNSSNMLHTKAQVVGWPPVRSYRKNCLQTKKMEAAGIYVKVSMDGAPYLRKIDMKMYMGYPELLKALEDMFKFTIGEYSEREGYNNSTNGSEYVATYEDKDGDWMLVGDVPWDMFETSCKRLRIMKGSEAKGLRCVV